MHTPSLTALRCLDACARLHSFTRAAAEMHLTQGAVSQQILGMERLLGVTLFTRKRTGLALTVAGRSYWNETHSAVRQIERATQNILTHQGTGGLFNLCVASSFGTYWLMPRLSGFVSAHPEITLNLATRVGPVDFVTEPFDAAIVYGDGAPVAGLTKVALMPLRLRAYVSRTLFEARGVRKTKPIARLLRDLPLIRHTTVPDAWAGWFAQSGVAAPNDGLSHTDSGPQYDLLSMALNAVIAGLGVALLPDYMAERAVQDDQIVRLSEHAWESSQGYYLQYPSANETSVVLRHFAQWVVAQALANTGASAD